MARKSKKPNTYFTDATQNAICDYVSSTDDGYKTFIYNTEIYPAMDKLVENVVHKYKFYQFDTTYEDLKLETISYIYEKLKKFTSDKGRAFSYFTVVARNYLIQKNKEVYTEKVNKGELQQVDDDRNVQIEIHNTDTNNVFNDFIKLWAEWGIDNVYNLYGNDKSQKIAEAVFRLFKDCEVIDSFNKKALYILIREQTKIEKTHFITRVVKDLKKLYGKMLREYLDTHVIAFDQYIYKRD